MPKPNTNIVYVLYQWEKEGIATTRLSLISSVLTCIFLFEVLMKVIAFTLRGYWQSRRNRYDLFVTLMGVAWVVLWHLSPHSVCFTIYDISSCK